MADRDDPVGGFLYRITRFCRRFYDSIGVAGGHGGHRDGSDQCCFRPSSGGMAAWRGVPEANVCREVDASRLLHLLESTLTP